MGLGLRAEQAPILNVVKFRPLFGETMSEFISPLRVLTELDIVGIADHVVMKTDAAHASTLHGQGLQQAAAAVLKTLRPDDDFFPHGGAASVDETAVVEMAMR